MRAIEIRTIDHKHQRGQREGDWHQPYGMPMKIMVSAMPHPDYEVIIAVRTLVEMYMCTKMGIADPLDNQVPPNIEERAAEIANILGSLLGISWTDFDMAKEALCKKT